MSFFKPEDFETTFGDEITREVVALKANAILRSRAQILTSLDKDYWWTGKYQSGRVPMIMTHQGLLVCVEEIKRECQHEPVEFQNGYGSGTGYFKPECRFCGKKLKMVPLEEPGETMERSSG